MRIGYLLAMVTLKKITNRNMTHRQALEAVRGKVIAANGDIMKLQFGCELLRGSKPNRHYKVIEDIGFAGNENKVWINSVPFGSMPLELDKDLIQNGGEFEILGRPIRLADVLLAIPKRKIDSMGGFDISAFSIYLNRTEIWFLPKNDLSLQSEETVRFLGEVLG